MSKKGFTIVEMLIASVLILLTVAIAYNAYLFTRESWLSLVVQNEMQRDGMMAIESMIRGVDANFKGIMEAQNILTPSVGSSSNLIEFVDGENPALTRSFYLSGDKLIYRDESNKTSELVEEGISSLTFTRPADRSDFVEIELIQQKNVLDITINVQISTSIKIRNM